MAQEPVDIVQGTTAEWERGFGDYSPSSYSCVYEIRGVSSSLTVTGVAGADEWTLTITAAQSAALAAGAYAWQAFVQSNTERHLIDSGALTVTADLATTPTPLDKRSHARRMLENLNAMLENQAYVKTLPADQFEQMTKVRKQYEWDVKREEDAEKLKRGGYPTRKVFTRFAPVGA